MKVHFDSNEYEELITKLKEKCEISNKEEKIKILSLLPSSWSRNKISKEFKVSERLVKLARDLVKKQGILPELAKRNSGKVLSLDTIREVTEFYLCEENSRICPGKKIMLLYVLMENQSTSKNNSFYVI